MFSGTLKFENESIITPTGWKVTPEAIENRQETEAGTVTRNIVRAERLTIQATFRTSSRWMEKLKAYSKEPQISVTCMDGNTLRTFDAFIDNFRADMIDNTMKMSGTNGLYNVTLTINEI